MHLAFFGSTFNRISDPIDTFESLVWTERWYDSGSFSLILPTSRYAEAKDAVFIYNSDTETYMLIEEIDYEIAAKKLTITGRSLEAMFDWRILITPAYTAKKVEDIARSYVYHSATGATVASCAFDNTPVVRATAKGYTETATVPAMTGPALSGKIRSLFRPLGWRYTLKRNPGVASGLLYDIEKPVDRRSTQTENQRAVFHSAKGDIINYRYNKNIKDYRNYAYMKSEWPYKSEGPVPDGVEFNLYDASLTGEERKFLYVTGKEDFTDDEMDSICIDALGKYPVCENVTAEISPACSLVYGINYSLGDWCDVVINEIGLAYSAQITSVDRVYEKNMIRVIPIFGEEKSDVRKFVYREVGR